MEVRSWRVRAPHQGELESRGQRGESGEGVLGNWWSRLAPNDVEGRLQAVQFDFEFESVELERGETGRRFDRSCSDADSDAHAVGHTVTNGVKCWRTRAVHAKGNCDAQQVSYASDGWTRESSWEACRWITELGGQIPMFDVDWWHLASNGVEWWLASNGVEWTRRMGGVDGWRRKASNGVNEGTDVNCRSGVCGDGVEWRRVVAGVDRRKRALTPSGVPAESNQRTGVVCLTDSRLPVVFVVPVMIEATRDRFFQLLCCGVLT